MRGTLGQTRAARRLTVVVCLALAVGTIVLGRRVSWFGAGIVAGSGFVALVLWRHTFVGRSPAPDIALPPYLVAIAGFYLHLVEEFAGHYGPAISRLFDVGWTDRGFALVAFVLAAVLALTAAGLHSRNPMAGFVAWLFLTSRLAECLLFVFPFMRPAIGPDLPDTLSRRVTSGVFVTSMPNYFHHTTGRYYFPGMYTVALAILPALYAMYRMWIATVVVDDAR